MRALVAALLLLALAAPAQAQDLPPPGPEPVYHPPHATRLRLANGMALLVVENHRLPLCSWALLVPGAGASADPPGKAGLAAFTADLLDEGAGGKSAMDIAETAARLGASLDIVTGADATLVEVSTLRRTLEPTLDLFAAVVSAPSFDPGEAARVLADRQTDLQLRRDRPREIADLVLQAALFGPRSPFGHPAAGLAADVATFSVADARGFYASAWDPARMTLVVAGDVDAASLRAALDARLGAWKRGAKTAAKPPRAKPLGKPSARLLLVDRPGAEQSDVRFGLTGPLRSDKRDHAWEVALNVFGGGFTGRLTQRLREQLGYLYHVYPSLDFLAGASVYAVNASLFTPKTVDGVHEILSMIAALASTDVPADELDKAKQNLIRNLPSLFATNRAVVTTFAELVRAGLPDTWYDGYARGVAAVTAKQVRSASAQLLAQGSFVFVVVGDLGLVRAGLEALGLGTPHTYDADGAFIQ